MSSSTSPQDESTLLAQQIAITLVPAFRGDAVDPRIELHHLDAAGENRKKLKASSIDFSLLSVYAMLSTLLVRALVFTHTKGTPGVWGVSGNKRVLQHGFLPSICRIIRSLQLRSVFVLQSHCVASMKDEQIAKKFTRNGYISGACLY
jgi:hypothetical protein